MFVDVISYPAEIIPERMTGKNIVVIDVLRCTSVIVTALANGALYMVPFDNVEDVWKFYHAQGNNPVIMGGERNSLPIEGFQSDNSPLSYTEECVSGKIVAITTTNGTRTIKASMDGDAIFIGSFLNVEAVVEQLMKDKKDACIVCSGTNDRFSMDDALCAGMIISSLRGNGRSLTDLGWSLKELYERNSKDLHKPLANCYHYKKLKAKGYEGDLEYCLQRNIYDVLPVYQDNKITLMKGSE